jgi:putative DNA primase/helicase
VAKSKDGADGHGRAFRLQQEHLGSDAEGEAITSCVVVPDTGAEEVRRVKLPQGGNQRIVWDALLPLLKDGELGKPDVPPMKRSIDLEAAISAVAGRLTVESHRRTQRTREAVQGLVNRGLLACQDGRLWQCA